MIKEGYTGGYPGYWFAYRAMPDGSKWRIQIYAPTDLEKSEAKKELLGK